MNILVTTDNFWLGGRENFLATYLGAAAGHGVSASLMATRIASNAAGIRRFENVASCECGGGSVEILRRWMDVGDAIVRTEKPRAIWAQHFSLLPAWILAVSHSIPLVTTFHGPLSGAGRPNPLIEALGMTLAAARGSVLSAVSPEVARSIFEGDADGREVRVIPNAVHWRQGNKLTGADRIRDVVCLSRTSKVGHLRAAVALFAQCRRICGTSRLAIAGGILPGEKAAGFLKRPVAAGRLLGFKWAFDARMLRVLPRTHIIGAVDEPMELIAQYGAVFGMGRVVLEALAAGRPAVVIGYESVADVVDGSNFDRFAERNFSGRGEPVGDRVAIARRLAHSSRLEPLTPAQIERYSLSAQTPRLVELLGNAEPRDSLTDRDLAGNLRAAILRGADESEVFEIGCSALSGAEMRMLYRFAKG